MLVKVTDWYDLDEDWKIQSANVISGCKVGCWDRALIGVVFRGCGIVSSDWQSLCQVGQHHPAVYIMSN